MSPYNDYQYDNFFYRVFNEDINDIEFVWHRDKRNRYIEVVECDGWKIQFDNKLPKELKEGDKIYIPLLEYHRIIKGKGRLVLKIKEV